MQCLQHPSVLGQVELVAGRTLEGRPPEGADLAREAVAAEEGKGASDHGRARDLEVNGHAPGAVEVDAARRPDERGELCEAAAGLPRLDRGELAAHVLREAHESATPSSSSNRCL